MSAYNEPSDPLARVAALLARSPQEARYPTTLRLTTLLDLQRAGRVMSEAARGGESVFVGAMAEEVIRRRQALAAAYYARARELLGVV